MKKSFTIKILIFALSLLTGFWGFSLKTVKATSMSAGATAVMIGDDQMYILDYTTLSGCELAIFKALETALSDVWDGESSSVDVGIVPVVPPTLSLDYDNIAVAKVSDYVNIRSGPDENSAPVGKLYKECAGDVLGQENGWVHIKSGNVDGYIRGDYVTIGDRDIINSVVRYRAKVTADALKLREQTSTNSRVLDLAWKDDLLLVIDDSSINQGWIKVRYGQTEGFSAASYTQLYYDFDRAESKAEEEARLAREAARASAKSAGRGSDVVSYALQFVGNPYVWGGTSLTKGADCSGFIMSVYKKFGVSLPHSSAADRNVGRKVSTSEMRPGDIICYSGHVALYIGNGQIVHAASKKSGIKVSNAFYRKILTVRRIF